MRIKPIRILLPMFLLIAGACSDDFDKNSGWIPSLEPRYLSISRNSFDHYSSAAFTDDAYVYSLGGWKFTGADTWYSVKPASGTGDGAVEISAEENTSAKSGRSGLFYLQSTVAGWQMSRPLSISQGAAAPVATPSVTSLAFGGGSETKTVDVEANCNWRCDAPSWIKTTVSGSRISVTTEENPGLSYRSGYLKIIDTEHLSTLAQVAIEQSPAKVTGSESTLTFENTAGKYEIELTSEAAWTSTASASWINVDPTSGNAGKSKVAIEVTPNTSTSQRTGYITFSTGTSQKLQISIVQKGIYIEHDELNHFSSGAGSQKVNVRSNTSWVAYSEQDWVTVSPSSGTGPQELTVTVTDNASTSQRQGEVTVKAEGLSLSSSISIVQAGKTFSPGVTRLDFSDKASSYTLDCTGDAPWTASTEDSWITVSPQSGVGDASVTVSVEENTTDTQRIGKVTITYLDRSIDILVTQEAKYFKMDLAGLEFTSKGGSHYLSISTNDKWSIKTDKEVSWLKISPLSGDTNRDVEFIAVDNASVNPRSVIVKVETENLQDVNFAVTQKARYLTVSQESILFFAKGGTSDAVTIDTDGEYEISGDAQWFTVQQTDNTFTVTATQNTTSDLRRGKVTISLTDLKEGSLSIEIPVIQPGEGGSFIIDGFGEDVNWGTSGNDKLNITVKKYTADKNWNFSGNDRLEIKIEGYDPDKNWNSSNSEDLNIKVNGFDPDNNWNP